MFPRSLLLLVILFFPFSLGVWAISYPVATPSGETPGGTYRTYFDNIFSSEILCYGSGEVVAGFYSDGNPICVVPAPTGLNILGSVTGDTLRYDGNNWVRNNLLYNNGTAIGIGMQNPSYILDVLGTANFTALRMPTGAGSGRILVSDSSGNFAWSDYSSGSTASGVVGGTENVLPKFGAGGNGLVSSQFFDDGTSIGVGTATPTLGYRMDISGADILINTLRVGRGGGNILSNTAFGWNALNSNATTTTTVALGYGAYSSLISGAGNVAVGNLAGSTLTSGSNNIMIGSSAQPTSATASNELNIGNWIFGSGGSIGIGTASPGAKLEIVGQVKITGGSPGPGKALVSDASGLASWQDVSASMVAATGVVYGTEYRIPKFGQYGSGLYSSVLYENLSGYIGLGNTNPTAELDVAGTIRIRSGASLGYILQSDATGRASWQPASAASNAWLLTGNAGTSSGNFLGTTDAQNLLIRTNSIERGVLYSSQTADGFIGSFTGGDFSINGITVGRGSGQSIYNTAFGNQALIVNTTGQYNAAFGQLALSKNTQGSINAAFGHEAMRDSTTSTYNAAFGAGAMKFNTTGSDNTAIGSNALGNGTTAFQNTAIGGAAMRQTLGSTNNVAVGYQALYNLQYGEANIGIGRDSGWGLVSGTGNILIGGTVPDNSINQLNIGNWIYGSGGNIGIGIINPQRKFVVRDDNPGTPSSAVIYNSNTSNGNGANLSFRTDTTGVGASTFVDSAGMQVVYDEHNHSTRKSQLRFYTMSGRQMNFGLFQNYEGNIGIGVSNPGQKLTVSGGTIQIINGTQGAGRFLVSDANGVASWQNTTSTLSGTYWSLSGNNIGVNDFLGTINSQDLRIRVNNSQIGRFYTGGSVVFGTGNSIASSNAVYLFGANNTVTGSNISVIGQNNTINNGAFDGIVLGNNNITSAGGWPIILGRGNRSPSTYDSPLLVGVNNVASYHEAMLIGLSNTGGGESGQPSLAVGAYNQAGDNFIGYREESTAVGQRNTVLHQYSSAFGRLNTINVSNSSVFGSRITNSIAGSTMIGPNNSAKITIFTGGQVAIGTSVITTGALLKVAGQVEITGGSPGVGKFLVSDATGLASWQTTTTALSGTYWALSGNNPGVSDFIGSLNAQDLRFRTNNIQRMVITSAGNVGIGITNPTTAQLELSGSAIVSGNLTVQGRLITDTIVNRTVTNVSVSGALFPDSNVPQIYRNIGATGQRWNNLFLSGQITLGGGNPGLNRILTSDANGLASWSSIFSGTTLASQVTGGASGYLSIFGNGGIGLGNSRFFQTGVFLGLGTTTPGYTLDVSGTGNFLGLRLPTGASNGLILASDASGNARWTSGFSGSYSSSGITGGVQNNVPKYGTGGNGLFTSQIFDNGSVVGIGTGNTTGVKVVIDSGLAHQSGLRLARINVNSPLVSNGTVALGIDASGTVLPISPISNIAVYTGVLRTTALSPNPDLNTFNITYDFNRYFAIPGKQSFVISQGNGSSYNGPYFRENGTSAVCSWNGTYGTSPYDCATAGPDGLSASPNNSFTMTAKGDTFGYQLALGARGDAQLFARSGRFNGSQTGGLYTNDSPYQTPAPWMKVVVMPVNHPEYFYINTGLNSQLQAISGGGNIGIGTTTPASRFEVWSGATSETLLHMRGTNNVGLGLGALEEDQTGNANTAVGAQSMFILTSGYSNTAMGYRSLRQTQAGFNNSAFGQEASYNNNGGSWNSALGYQALYSSTSGTGNIAIGPRALYNLSTGHNNIAIGFEALRVIAGSNVTQNIGIGFQSLYSTTASNLTAIGHRALYANSSGLRNTALGFEALDAITTLSDATAVGYQALTNATGSGNTALGAAAGDNITSGNNNIIIGANVDAVSATASNQLNIGNWIYGNGGNIGIGTTTTTERLNVAGTGSFYGIRLSSGAVNGYVLKSDASGNARWAPESGGGGGGGGWSLVGDAGTVPGTNFIGTTDAVDFLVYTNGSERIRVESGGDVGIGTNNPTSRLDVNGTFELGANGTQLSGILKATVNRDLPSIANNACNTQTFTVTNALTTGTAMVSPANALNDRLFITYARVSAANTVEAKFCNVSGASINMAAMNFYITVIQ